ncbi:ZINC-FINGER HOMEODOMAIN PROTEIN 1 [Salix koriyanagi]|uniref:ZINC-FINGER HOMEODOMAIN PROTEIN 1 n=1 Tax=Salix koriyanagi TaxID=2511006 RepID=A0A9Q0P5I0_9ROSI|nr:ZINC-FINGER HOMEODOMAIN PROTEIN 1 [Salix koriyanagi]
MGPTGGGGEGEEGNFDALKCAACNWHRNFHCKETDGGGGGEIILYHSYHHQQQPKFSPYYRDPPPAWVPSSLDTNSAERPLALPAASGGGGGRGGGGGGSSSKKRFGTKFSPEQKEKMLAFAERLGWRIQKHDEASVEQFSADNGLKQHVLKKLVTSYSWCHGDIEK